MKLDQLLPRTENIFKLENKRANVAIYLLAISVLLLHSKLTQAGLIKVYHKHPADGEPAASDSSQLADLKQLASAFNDENNSRASTIEISSPMKRIMELIGHHAPVIVLDGGGEQTRTNTEGAQDHQQQQQAPVASAPPTVTHFGSPSIMMQPQQQQQHHMLPSEVAQHQNHILIGDPSQQQQQQQQQHFVSSQQHLLGQPQQQHWTILDASQLAGQQPTAQQQQLVQSTAIPNDQYFTFTPFGLNPVGPNPFMPHQQPQQSFISYPQLQAQQQQQQQQDFGPAQGQMTQSSQNHQQQQNEVQPVFLSSYVPELPVGPGGSSFGGGQDSLMQAPLGGQFGLQQQQQQPNSIQQIQQAQQQDEQAAAKRAPIKAKAKAATSGESESSGESETGSKSKDDDEPGGSQGSNVSEGDQAGGANEDDQSGEEPRSSKREVGEAEPSSGSLSYEDKYDSDKDDDDGSKKSGGKRGQMSDRSQEPAAAAATSAAGMVHVGLNDDCLQCICRASSGCDFMLRCITIGSEEKYCGPFQLTEEYWLEAGKPGDSQENFSSFEDCANDVDCATETVTSYMLKNKDDCDGDLNITCLDYARIHRLKKDECRNTKKLLAPELGGYWEKFQRCAEGFNRTRNGDDEDI